MISTVARTSMCTRAAAHIMRSSPRPAQMRSKPPNVPPTPLRYLKSSKKKEGFDFRYFTVMASLTVLPLCMLLGPGVYDWWQFYKQDDGIEYD